MVPILARQRELSRRLSDRLCPTDARIQGFLKEYLADAGPVPSLPRRTLVLDQAGLARGLSLPHDADFFKSPLLSSYRLRNGVLHNPAKDRRTTAGVFHVVEGGLPIPDDKLAVPKVAFSKLLSIALNPPDDSMRLPYTANASSPGGRALSHCCFARWLCRQSLDSQPKNAWKSASLCRAGWFPILTLSKASLAMGATPIYRKTMPRLIPTVGPATPVA